MSTGGKLVVTLGIASGALFAAWLLTGSRKGKTKQFVSRKSNTLREAIKLQRPVRLQRSEEPEEINYI